MIPNIHIAAFILAQSTTTSFVYVSHFCMTSALFWKTGIGNNRAKLLHYMHI